MLIIKNNGKPATVRQLADAIKRTKIVPENKYNRLPVELRYLQDGPERFGEVDLKNQQQVELVAWRIVKGGILRPARGRQPRPILPDVYELALIGAGSTTAYYLDTLGPAYDHSKTVVIGEANPWIRQRGKGITYINHTLRQIEMPSLNVTKYGGNESYADRETFGRAAEAVIASRVKRWLKEPVAHIKKMNDVYRISYGRPPVRSLKARRVIFAAGAGSVRTPPEVKKEEVHNRARIIEMNTFIRDKAKQEDGKVVVWGSNAAIDAVAAAVKHEWTVGAWLYSKDNKPAWLPGTRYLSAPYNLHQVNHYVYQGRDDIVIEDDDDGLLKVRDKGKGQVVADKVTYVVYGIGSEDLLSEKTGPNKTPLMDDSVKEGKPLLSPILDEQGVFGDPTDDEEQDDQDKAFLGWQNATGTFCVFGLSAENYAGVPGDRAARINSLKDERVLALKRWISGDVLTVGQLTYIRSALRAFNHYIAGSIEHAVDYSHSDANTLRVHLAARYPDLPEIYATRFISMMRTVRMDLQARLPHGFTEEQVDYIETQLDTKERAIRQGGTNTTHDATQWQLELKRGLENLTPALGGEVEKALAKLRLEDR